MVDHGGSAETPDQIVVELGTIYGHLAFCIVADTSPTRALSATITIANDIVFALAGMVAGADPRGGRWHRARRAIVRAAAAARAQEPIDRAVLPVVAGGVVVEVRFLLFRFLRKAGHPIQRQKRQHRCTEHSLCDVGKKAPARGSLRDCARQALDHSIHDAFPLPPRCQGSRSTRPPRTGFSSIPAATTLRSAWPPR